MPLPPHSLLALVCFVFDLMFKRAWARHGLRSLSWHSNDMACSHGFNPPGKQNTGKQVCAVGACAAYEGNGTYRTRDKRKQQERTTEDETKTTKKSGLLSLHTAVTVARPPFPFQFSVYVLASEHGNELAPLHGKTGRHSKPRSQLRGYGKARNSNTTARSKRNIG
jgi:hypothetical protein